MLWEDEQKDDTAGFRCCPDLRERRTFQSDPVGRAKDCSQSETARRLKVAAANASASGCDDHRRDGEASGCARPRSAPAVSRCWTPRSFERSRGVAAVKAPRRTASRRRSMELSAGRSSDRRRVLACAITSGHVWKILRALGWSPQRPVGKARAAQRRGHPRLAAFKTWPAIKKKPGQRRTYDRLHRRKRIESEAFIVAAIWAPRGETPVLEFNFELGQVLSDVGRADVAQLLLPALCPARSASWRSSTS